jgi:hypothetical protein
VCTAFAIGIGLAVHPALPSGVAEVSVRGVAHTAIQLARDTRNATREVAHQIRAATG